VVAVRTGLELGDEDAQRARLMFNACVCRMRRLLAKLGSLSVGLSTCRETRQRA
jgi:hypothetical protein